MTSRLMTLEAELEELSRKVRFYERLLLGAMKEHDLDAFEDYSEKYKAALREYKQKFIEQQDLEMEESLSG